MEHNGWDHALKVTADGAGLAGHAGAILLRKAADQAGLAAGLGAALRKAGQSPVFDRGIVLVSVAAAIALGATSMSDIAVLAHLAPVLGAAPSGPTVRRALDLAGTPAMLDRIARARARARAHAWTLIEGTPAGFRWLVIAGKALTGWVVIDMDATLITAYSDKEGAAPTWKKGYGFHPLAAWCSNTRECLAMLLRPGNAGSNTFTEHRDVLAAAIRQVPARFRRKILVRVDGAGASHELVKHLPGMSSPRRTVLFSCGWMITAADEDAIAMLPAGAWKPGIAQDGGTEEDKAVAEITRLMSRAGNWPGGLRWIVRRVKPSRRQMRNLTAYEKQTGWRYSIICTNIPDSGIGGVPGSHHPQYIDVVHREHAVVETGGVRAAKAMGLRALPYVENLGGQLRLGHRREHRRRPGGLDPPARLPRRRGPAGRRPRYAALPDLAPPRPPGPSRPPAHPQDQPRLALEGGLPHLLAAAVRPACTRLTTTNRPSCTKGGAPRRGRSRCDPGTPGATAQPAPAARQTSRPKPGASTISSRTSGPLND
jgi:Transposase DDE domain group 1